MNVEQRLAFEIERAEIRAEIAAIRARPDRLLEMPVVNAARREEYKQRGEREVARLEALLDEETPC